MRNLTKIGGHKAYRVVMDSVDHVVIAPTFEAALVAAREWWRSDPDSAADEDCHIDISSVEALADYGAVILSDSDHQVGVGVAGIRDPLAPCAAFLPGAKYRSAGCDGDGHYLCRECRHWKQRQPESAAASKS